MVYLMFAGSRWIVILYKGGKSQSLDDLKQQALESHPFWDRYALCFFFIFLQTIEKQTSNFLIKSQIEQNL